MVLPTREKDGYKNIVTLADGKSYTDKKVEKGSRYYYHVAVKTKDGKTWYSKPVLFECPLSRVSGVKLIRYSTISIKVAWDAGRDKQVKCYKVYYATKELGTYKLAGTTKNNWYRVKDLKNNQSYYFRVVACAAAKDSGRDSEVSKTVTMRTMPYERLTIFAGDSITSGFSSYNMLGKIGIGGKKKVIAAVGLNTMTFRTKRVFNGQSGLNAVISNKPYRVYIMLGSNDIHYRQTADVVDDYRTIVKSIQSGSPDTDIVVLAISPVTAATKNKRTGFKRIPEYNKALQAMTGKLGVKFYDCTAFMKDSSGWLKSSYVAGDGMHWKSPVYNEYVKLIEAYDKSQD